MQKKLNNWIRQARYRAKRYGNVNRLQLADVQKIWDEHGGKCAYCGNEATNLDNPFSLASGAPNVAANCLPACRNCKQQKGMLDLTDLYNGDIVTRETYITLIRTMLQRDGAEEMRQHLRESAV